MPFLADCEAWAPCLPLSTSLDVYFYSAISIVLSTQLPLYLTRSSVFKLQLTTEQWITEILR